MRLIKGHLLKIRRTAIPVICIGLPVIYSLLLFAYLYLPHKGIREPQFMYHSFFLFFVMAALFVLSILIPLFLQLDSEASGFGNELRIGVPRWKLYVSRLSAVLLLLIGVEILALAVYSGLIFLTNGHLLAVGELLFLSIVSLYFLMPIILIYLIISFRFQLSGSILLGIIFFLSGFLLGTTGLGDLVWRYLPWIWPARMLYQVVPHVLWETGRIRLAAINDLSALFLANVVLTSLLLFLSVIWYNQWEGMSSLEE